MVKIQSAGNDSLSSSLLLVLRLRHLSALRSDMAFMFNFSFPELSDLTAGNVFHGAAPSTAAAAQPEEERKASESATGNRSDVYDLTQSGTVEDKILLPFQEHRVFGKTEETTASDEVKLDTALLLSAVIPETEWNTLAVGDITLQFVSPDWLDQKLYNLPEAEVTSEGATASDIVPNVYEGGFRVWDGACDMLSFVVMNEHVSLKDKKVLELGCGAGLPGIFALLQGADVYFHDYNAEVILSATIPNLQQNVLVANKMVLSEVASRTKFFSGDWLSFAEQVNSTKGDHMNKDVSREEEAMYDVILTSDTVYRKDVLQKLCFVLPLLLRKDGTIYLAGKSHYFGLDGGTDELRLEFAKQNKLEVIASEEYPDCVRREVLTIRWKPKTNDSASSIDTSSFGS